MKYNSPKRIFEDAAAVDPETSYYVPLGNVKNNKGQTIKTMIDMGRYFSIFAPRQSGKTTFFDLFCLDLKKDLTYITIQLSFQDFHDLNNEQFYSSIEKDLYNQLQKRLKEVQCEKVGIINKFLKKHRLTDHLTFKELFIQLNEIIEFKKIVIFIDEFDGIPRAELENFLCTLRELYQRYKRVKQKALYSVAMVGIRNITQLIVGGVSPFNIADKVQLPPFSLNEVKELYSQYTMETNQPFTEDAIKKVYTETAGQPWLVNRIGTISTVDVKPTTVAPITSADIDKAISILLNEHNNHFDNLVEKAKKFKDVFVEIVFNGVKYKPDDEVQSLLQLHGLIKEDSGKATVTNNIYKQRYLNMFFNDVKEVIDIPSKRHYHGDGFLKIEIILEDFKDYITEIGVNAFYSKDKPYEKTGQYLLTAFLYQFIVGTDGFLKYECLTGVGKMDILLTHKRKSYIIETKVNRGNLTTTTERATKQLIEKYMNTQKQDKGYIVIFDTKAQVGDLNHTQIIEAPNGKQVVVFSVGIGR